MAVEFASGTVPQVSDSLWTLWVKYVQVLQANAGAGAKAHNDPQITDTIRTLELKATRSREGI